MLLPDMPLPLPDYGGGSIVNLMASLIRSQGGKADYPNLRLLPPEEIQGHTNVMLLVIDGLGADWLTERSPAGILNRHRLGNITSVFPTTTASAITTFLTGDAPQQHGITGWFTYFRELGCVMSVLPGHPRYGGIGYRQAGVDLAALLGHRCLANRIRNPVFFVTPANIAHSDYNLAHLGSAQVRPFEDLRDMFRQAGRVLRADPHPKYLYLYWPGLDSRGHDAGMDSPLTARHLEAIEQALTDFMVASAGTDTLVLVTADHGLIDTRPADRIELTDHPELAACLSLPLCGEPRAAFCYLRPHHIQTFEDYCQQVLGAHALVRPSQELILQGLFGEGEPHPRLQERVGDYSLLFTGRGVIREQLPSEKNKAQIGVHGGLSATELFVPLCGLET